MSRQELERELTSKLVVDADTTAKIMDKTADSIRQSLRLGQIAGAHKVGRQWRIPTSTLRRMVGIEQPAESVREAA